MMPNSPRPSRPGAALRGPALPFAARRMCYPAGLMFGLRWKTLPGS